MGTSEAVLPSLSTAVPHLSHSKPCLNSLNSMLHLKSDINSRRKRALGYMRLLNCSRMLRNCRRVYSIQGIDGFSHGKTKISPLESVSCKGQQAESVSGITAEDGHGTIIAPKIKEFEMVEPMRHEKGGFASNGKFAAGGTINDTLGKASIDSIEDEAWNLLRESIVFYCGNPIGTIAANDPSNSSSLNYDQVFIRDFIPSGIAFLLKGEYDIVRSFILHTLQLQVQ